MIRNTAISAVLIAATACWSAEPDGEGFVSLFNGRDLSGWVPVNVAPGTFTVKESMIVCTGQPTGFMRTDRHYENFIVELEWRHTIPKRNSGFFLWGDALPAVGSPFTRGVEVQILDGLEGDWYTSQGDVFPIWGATLRPDNPRPKGGQRAYPTENRTRPSPEWNHYRIECRDGNISLAVNGKVVTTAHDAAPRRGYLCLESEGGVVQFWNLRIKELPAAEPALPSDQVASLDEGYRSLYTGVDLSGWKIQGPAGDHWSVSDYTFGCDGKGEEGGRTLWTERNFGQYKLIIDFRTDKPTEVAVFLRGSDGPVLHLSAGAGGIGPAGRWNRLTATVLAGMASVALNGQDQPRIVVPSEPSEGAVGLRVMGVTSFANVFIATLDKP